VVFDRGVARSEPDQSARCAAVSVVEPFAHAALRPRLVEELEDAVVGVPNDRLEEGDGDRPVLRPDSDRFRMTLDEELADGEIERIGNCTSRRRD
jgi:hypothetical protein